MLKIRKKISYKSKPIEYDLILREEQRYIRLKIVEDNIVVSAPTQAQDWEIEQLIYKNINKIIKVIEFREKYKKVEIGNPGFIKIFDEKQEVFFKQEIDKNNKFEYKIYENDLETIKHMYKKIAIVYEKEFVKRVNFWKEKMDLDFKNLTIKEMKGKWGICYPKKSRIVLNTRLIHYPENAMNYVIVHELSHLVHENHSKDFWYHVQKYLPEYKSFGDLLKLSI
ncbi:zinc metalloprotease [Spiroplasma chinense]|uniref:Zinc metalloprotease n=1 Tax=Spiroplasma chinense TaxID=216932 RepID=A0A5B9Y4B6_9MOLU|nr:SprT-like domain-containing protein [Spiroplasma chinense]QEH61516.1 zinc metalloprotease [Spiroplasma chinense]